jgi:16S rRNA (guanine(966)-N(2))-methyltransferase RsmD
MRIISGIFKGRRLKTVEGLEVRPTSDRLRETLFNILAPHLRESHFLDLCAGSGAIGIEAYSRGAGMVVFVEQSRRAALAIQENLSRLGVTDQTQIIQREAMAALKQLATTSGEAAPPFTIVYFDPPYASELYERVLEQLGASPILDQEAIVVVEHRSKHTLAEAYGSLKRYREVRQGESALAFYALQTTHL